MFIGFWEVFLDSEKCFNGFWEVFLDSGMRFWFWDVFWILGSALDSGTCFGFGEVISLY